MEGSVCGFRASWLLSLHRSMKFCAEKWTGGAWAVLHPISPFLHLLHWRCSSGVGNGQGKLCNSCVLLAACVSSSRQTLCWWKSLELQQSYINQLKGSWHRNVFASATTGVLCFLIGLKPTGVKLHRHVLVGLCTAEAAVLKRVSTKVCLSTRTYLYTKKKESYICTSRRERIDVCYVVIISDTYFASFRKWQRPEQSNHIQLWNSLPSNPQAESRPQILLLKSRLE